MDSSISLFNAKVAMPFQTSHGPHAMRGPPIEQIQDIIGLLGSSIDFVLVHCSPLLIRGPA
jgi:hypothetical protein